MPAAGRSGSGVPPPVSHWAALRWSARRVNLIRDHLIPSHISSIPSRRIAFQSDPIQCNAIARRDMIRSARTCSSSNNAQHSTQSQQSVFRCQALRTRTELVLMYSIYSLNLLKAARFSWRIFIVIRRIAAPLCRAPLRAHSDNWNTTAALQSTTDYYSTVLIGSESGSAAD